MSGDAEHDEQASEAGGSAEHGARRGEARGYLHRYLPITTWLPSYRRDVVQR